MAPTGQGEFKKLVYESKFTKPAEGMSFVNFLTPQFCPPNRKNTTPAVPRPGRPKPH